VKLIVVPPEGPALVLVAPAADDGSFFSPTGVARER
jgi:hypothetical protein